MGTLKLLNKTFFFAILVLVGANYYAQTSISGYITLNKNPEERQTVYLSTNAGRTIKWAHVIASTTVDENGFFSLQQRLAKEEKLYTLFINNKSVYKSFILSNVDTLFFNKSKIPFTDFTTTNTTDTEYQKFRKFIEKQDAYGSNHEVYLNEIHNYTKDSLQILAIKLLSIKTLKDKNLLKKDIALNSKYYANLLKTLKKSTINASAYAFLERELVFYNLKAVEGKYYISKIINCILVFLLLGAMVYLFSFKLKTRGKEGNDLSKQEQNIKNLIIEGKSNKDIADALFISLSTVKTHITSIYSKLHVSNRAELIAKYKN